MAAPLSSGIKYEVVLSASLSYGITYCSGVCHFRINSDLERVTSQIKGFLSELLRLHGDVYIYIRISVCFENLSRIHIYPAGEYV